MRISIFSTWREQAWRRFTIIVGLVTLTFGLSTVSSAAATPRTAPAVPSVVAVVPVHQVPPGNGRFIPRHTRGDTEFAGHGPDVQADAHIVGLHEGSTTLSFALCMKAVETKSDFTTAEGCTGLFPAFKAPPDQCIESVSNGIFEELNYIDNDNATDIFGPQIPNSFVQTWDVVGDTDGKEAGTRTGLRITTKPFTVTTAPC